MKNFKNYSLVVLSLLSLSWLINVGTIDYPLVYDDKALVAQRDSSLDHSLGDFLSTRHEGLGRHLTVISIDLNRAPSGSTAPFHVTNTLLLGLSGVALYCLGLALGLAPAAAWTGAAIFVVHPLHTAAVVPVSGRSELLSAIFVLAAAGLYLTGRHPLRYGRLALLCLLFLAGLASKENAVVLLPILCSYEALCWLRASREAKDGDTEFYHPDYRALAALLLAGLAWFAAVYRNFATLSPIAMVDNPLAYVSVLERIPQAAALLWRYAARTVWPWPQENIAAVTSFTPLELSAAVIGWLALLALVAWAVSRVRLRPSTGLLLLWFALAFSTTANVFFPVGTAYSERLAFLPSAGPALLAGALLFPLSRGKFRSTVGATLALFILVVGASGYLAQSKSWTSEFDFHRQATATSPASAKAHYDLGLYLAASGRLNDALGPLQRSVELSPGFSEGTLYLTETLVRLERIDDAIQVWTQYIALRPDDNGARSRLMATLTLAENWPAAAAQARELVARGRSEFSGLAIQLELNASGADVSP